MALVSGPDALIEALTLDETLALFFVLVPGTVLEEDEAATSEAKAAAVFKT